MRLIAVRHPAPAVAAGLCYGSSDIPVDPAALRAALANLAQSLPHGAHIHMVSSPLQRCTALSMALAAQWGLPPPLLEPRLAEMDFGAWELRPWDAIARAEIDAWTADLVHYAPGGGETVLQVARRVADFVDALRRAQVSDAVVVCHAGTIRLLAAIERAGLHGAPPGEGALAAIALQAAATPHRIDYGGIVTMRF
ncbi:histidine phosphatase family protein [Massilia sp. DWR3-1-1]|uniref:histidine phosphatase family protein n=1 Tax=Massilia sp. DWR3-1-1 TaxID=2804559 RepID=UPI003CEFF7E2